MNATAPLSECIIVATVLTEPKGAIPLLLGSLTAADFADSSRGAVFACALELWGARQPIDHALVAAEIDRRGEIEGITATVSGVETHGAIAVEAMSCAVMPSVSGIAGHAKRVRSCAQLRRMDAALTRAQAESQRGQFTPLDILSELRDYVDVEIGRQAESPIGMHDAVMALGSQYAAQASRPESIVSTGIDAIDGTNRHRGFLPGNLVIIGARPGVGKTSLAATIAANVGYRSRVLVIQAEQAGWEQTERVASVIMGADIRSMWENADSRKLWGDLAATCDAIMVETVADGPAPTLPAIIGHAHRAHATRGLSLLIVDQLSKIARSGNREERMTEREWFGRCSWSLKRLAQDLGIVVVLLHQCNRATKQARRPAMNNLEGSGKLEQDADCVILLDRDDAQDETRNLAESPSLSDILPPDQAWLSVAKRRGGWVRTTTIRFHGPTGRFSDMDAPRAVSQPRDRVEPVRRDDDHWSGAGELRDDVPFDYAP